MFSFRSELSIGAVSLTRLFLLQISAFEAFFPTKLRLVPGIQDLVTYSYTWFHWLLGARHRPSRTRNRAGAEELVPSRPRARPIQIVPLRWLRLGLVCSGGRGC